MLLTGLVQRLWAAAPALSRAAAAAAELDCLLSLASAAAEYGWCRPQLSEDPVLEIRGGRWVLGGPHLIPP